MPRAAPAAGPVVARPRLLPARSPGRPRPRLLAGPVSARPRLLADPVSARPRLLAGPVPGNPVPGNPVGDGATRQGSGARVHAGDVRRRGARGDGGDVVPPRPAAVPWPPAMIFDFLAEVLFGLLPKRVRWTIYGALLAIVVVGVLVVFVL